VAAESCSELDIVLQYRREPDDLTSGRIVLLPGERANDPDATAHGLEVFERLEYKKVLTLLARAVTAYPEARVVFLRTDRPGLLPYVLDAETTKLLRMDPVAAIHAMTYEVPAFKSVRPPRATTPIEPAPLHVGYDTLADGFGENVYVRLRADSIECPGCGFWGKFVGREEQNDKLFQCEKRCWSSGIYLHLRLVTSTHWAAIHTEELLASPLERFYLPHAWNEGRAWISREELLDKYLTYKKEKEGICSLSKTI